jgi:hypothetical protein
MINKGEFRMSINIASSQPFSKGEGLKVKEIDLKIKVPLLRRGI